MSVRSSDGTFLGRVRQNPGPAAIVSGAALVLLLLEFGAIATMFVNLLPWGALGQFLPAAVTDPLAGVADALTRVPTLLSRDVIPNQGYQHPDRGWQGTFLGLSPAVAWFLRVVLIYVYAFAWLVLLWTGFNVYREHYRAANWTPTDDRISRLRSHYWGLFGVVVVFMFVVMAVFAPAMGPTTVEQNIERPFSHEISYYDEEAGEVVSETVGNANFDAASKGTPQQNVGPLSYDSYGRYHPIGTLTNGKDMFTFMAAGARVSLAIAITSITLQCVIAVVLAVLTAYYKGATDLSVVITGDSVQAIPQLLLLILLASLLRDTWLGALYNGAFALSLIFVLTGWPYLWRAVRGPALQIAEREWILASKSYGQRPSQIMRKHMAPYIASYLLIYASLSLGGIIIGVAGLSFLGLGITTPTPEWGRAINMGQNYVTSASWHISLIPGVMIVVLVTAFNALGDGIRDALDPESESGDSAEVAASGGAGA
jgi:peptide/nickel transport system permease protein